MKDLSGLTIKGYDLIERIGAGGFGAVYRADQSAVGREVAVKIILPGFSNQPDFIRRFESEARLVARLEHPYIVPLYDYWRDPSGAYLVMRWLREGSLHQALQERPFPLTSAAQILAQVASGLALAHRNGVIHRDVKPSNILLDEEGNAYLSDFGIAHELRRASNGEKSEGVKGTLDYLSPEQARNEPVGPAGDIYSLGVTLYELLTGRHPFPDRPAVERMFKHLNEPLPQISTLDGSTGDAVNRIIQKATAKKPAHRYQDVVEMATAFQQAVGLEQAGEATAIVETLTPREQEILALIVEGHANRQIAQELFIELSTVKWYITQIYRKLGVRSRVQAMVRARELQLVVPSPDRQESLQSSASLSTLPEPLIPYKGLRAFEASDTENFFGRETMVERLLARLAQEPGSDGAPARFLAVVGPSGSGKSSLIKAGLVPAIWRGALPGSEHWFVIEMLPGAQPLDELEIALMRIAADQSDNLRPQLERDSLGLHRVTNLILPRDDSELLLVIDQFEELFTLVDDELAQRQFLNLLHGAVSTPRSRIRVIISLRADFYDRPLQVPQFGELVRRRVETLLPLSAEELERAIVKPAEQAGVQFEPGLVATIIEEVNYQPGALPLLQYALTELFEQREGRQLTRQAYEQIGGASGALARRADELYQEQDEAGRDTIRQMFLRLVTTGDFDSRGEGAVRTGTRRRAPRTELLSAAADPDQITELIDAYAAYRLLSLDHEPGTRRPTVEVAHEAILREWDRLRGWLEESLVDLGLHRQLMRSTREWIEADRDESFLMRGARLDRFENWAADTSLTLTVDERSLIDASIQFREKRMLAERERQEKEARLERQSNRRLKALVAILALASVVSIGLTAASLSFARRAAEQERLATSRELAAAAVSNLDLDPERSVLLALEAARVTYAADGTVLPGVEAVLRQAIQADRIELTIAASGMLAYSPDGRMLAIGGEEGRLTLWNALTGDLIQEFPGHGRHLISGLVFSRDGEILVSGGFDSLVKIWHVSSGRLLGELRTFGMVNTFALSADASHVAVALRDGDVQVWEIASIIGIDSIYAGSDPPRLRDPTLRLETPGAATGVAFSPDARRLAAIIPTMSVFVWDPRSGKRHLEIQGADNASGISFSPGGDYLVAGSGDASVAFWDVQTGEEILTFHETSPISDLGFSRSGDLLATATHGGTVTLWDTRAGRQKQIIRLPGRSDGTNKIALHPDGRHLATGSDQGMTRIWDLRPTAGTEILALAAHEGEVYDAIYSPDGTQIASTGSDGAVRVWDSATGEQLLNLRGALEEAFFPAFSPNGAWLAAANQDGGVSVWDVRSGQELFVLKSETMEYTTVAFSPDGSQLATAGRNGTVTVWDMVSGIRLSTFDNSHPIIRLVYDPDGQSIWSYDGNGYATRWDVNPDSQNPLYTEAATKRVCTTTLWDADITQDGRRWAAAGFDGLLHVYEAGGEAGDTQRFSRLYKLAGHTGNVTGTAFNPDGTLLASSSYDGSVKLWDMDAGQELLTLSKQPLPVGGVDFNPDGDRLVTAGSDGKVSIYLISIEEVMETAQSRLSRGLTVDECGTYLRQATCREE